MPDANVTVNFAASVGDLISGIAEAREALSGLSAPSQQLNADYEALRVSIGRVFDPGPLNAYGAALSGSAALEASLAAAHAEAAAAIRSGDQSAFSDAVRTSKEAINQEIKDLQDGLKQKLADYAQDARLHQISEQQKVAYSRAALDEELAAQTALLQREGELGVSNLAQHQALIDRRLAAEQRYNDEISSLTRQSVDEQYRLYESLGASITGSFNSQLRGLLSGTESWGAAFKKVLGDLLIDFIEWCEKSVMQYVAGEAAKTAATTAGVSARTGAEQAGAIASLAAQGAAMMRSILSSAAEAFAGVFGFLAPLLGPAAAGPAAGAYGAVAAMAGSVASADIGMWNVPEDMLTLIHHNELVMPSTEATSLREMLAGGNGAAGSSVHVAPTTHFHISAVDSGSVAQWMKANSSTMLSAIDEAVRHGAALGMKRLQFR